MDPVSGTAIIGTSQTWDQAYQKLEPYEVNIVGAALSVLVSADWHSGEVSFTFHLDLNCQ
jgi:hypothetical protein